MAKRLLVIVVLAATTSGPVVGRHILNGAFDEDLTGWNVPSPPNTEIAWDSFGEPAGSLRVTTSEPGLHFAVFSECFSGPEGIFLVGGRSHHPSRAPALMLCAVELRGWTGTDCTGSPVFAATPNPVPYDEWVPWQMGMELGAGANAQSVAVALQVYRFGGAGETTCYYDNITLTGPPQPTLEIPAFGAAGRIVLVGAIALAAAVLLRRRVLKAGGSRNRPAI